MEKNTLVTWLLCAVLLVSIVNLVALISVPKDNNQPATLTLSQADKQFIQTTVSANQQVPESNESAPASVSSQYTLTKSEFEDQAIEDEALKLANESVFSRDFKKSAFDALAADNVTIESYKDITDVKILDFSINGDEVDYKVKLYYFIDGDKDETQKARLAEFTVTVDNLDFDENFVDAEVDDSYMGSLDVIHVYD